MEARPLMLLLLAACGTDDGLRGYDNCGGEIGDDVPAFYASYFKCADIAVDSDGVRLTTTNLPPYASPYYDTSSANWVEFDDRGGEWFQNPNVLSEQEISVFVPTDPESKGLTIDDDLVDLEMGTSAEEYDQGTAGIGLDGIAYFNATAAPGDSILDEAYSFDLYEGHPEMSGVYHHHSASPGPLEALGSAGYLADTTVGGAEWELYGILCDGTVLLGCDEMDGSAVDATTLDAQDGHVADVTDTDGTVHFPGRYHVHMCTDYAHYGLAPEIMYYSGCSVQGR